MQEALLHDQLCTEYLPVLSVKQDRIKPCWEGFNIQDFGFKVQDFRFKVIAVRTLNLESSITLPIASTSIT